MNTNKINVEKVNAAILEIETALTSMSANFDAVSNVSKDLNSAWSSEHSIGVASKVNDIYDKLGLLKTSIENLKTKVQQVVSDTSDADKVTFNE